MPNQLANSKRRKSLAEHQAVLAALDVIAQHEGTTVTALLRRAVRDLVRRHASQREQAAPLRDAFWQAAPSIPARFRTPAQLARFKRQQREFDDLVQELELAEPSAVQARNSVIPPACEICILGLKHRDATPCT